jgi:glycolate oxidase
MSMPASLVDELRSIVGADGLVCGREELSVYECDGYTLERSQPEVVVLPRTTAEVAAVVRACRRHDVRFVPRGAGTGLSGGCLPIRAPVMIGLARMNHILDLDAVNRTVRVQAGVVNRDVSTRAAPHGLYYAPDPSSQPACTIGGNVAENSGGPHTLKYGVTTNHVLSVQLVCADGSVVELGGACEDVPGYDLRGVVIGSEGTFGLVTEATLRLLPLPEGVRTLLATFDRVDDASAAVSAIIGAGIVPAALEMMDALMIAAVEAAYRFGFPKDAEAVLIIEIDGARVGLDRQAERIVALCRERAARDVRVATDGPSALLWEPQACLRCRSGG